MDRVCVLGGGGRGGGGGAGARWSGVRAQVGSQPPGRVPGEVRVCVSGTSPRNAHASGNWAGT